MVCYHVGWAAAPWHVKSCLLGWYPIACYHVGWAGAPSYAIMVAGGWADAPWNAIMLAELVPNRML